MIATTDTPPEKNPHDQVVRMLQGSGPVRKLIAPVAPYTRFVIFGRSFLWVLVAATVAVVIWVGAENNGEDGSRLVFSNVQPAQVVEDAMQNVMMKPHYQGMDANNQPYTVVADEAIQKDKETVILQRIRADMVQKDGTWVALNAGSGELNTETKDMLLMQGVDMFYDGGFEFRTDHAQVDINKGHAYGDSPIEGQGPPGTLKADSFSVEDNGKVIRFNGSVRMTLYR